MDGGQVVEVSAPLIPSEFLNINSIIILKIGIFFSNLFNYMFFLFFCTTKAITCLQIKKCIEPVPQVRALKAFIP